MVVGCSILNNLLALVDDHLLTGGSFRHDIETTVVVFLKFEETLLPRHLLNRLHITR